MSKFVIECPEPKCGRYVEAKTGFWIFGKKKINCACGREIDIRTDKLTSRTCPHCGNNVVFDQSKGEKAKCPICHEPINTMAVNAQTVEFSCSQCGIRLRTAKGAVTYECPVCDCVNDVAERVEMEKIRHDGLASTIKYEGDNSTFVWKHPIEDFNYGSQLIVHESQEAIFFRDGQALDTKPPGIHTLEAKQLPILEKLYKLPTDNEGVFHSEVYFINKTVQMAVKWGANDKVRFIDPLTSTPLELGISGEMNLAVSDGRKMLIKLVGTMKGIRWDNTPETVVKQHLLNERTDLSKKEQMQRSAESSSRAKLAPDFTKSLQESFRPLITNAVKINLPKIIKQNEIDILEIEEKLDLISEALVEKIRPGFEEYGLTIPQFYVNKVVLPEDDTNFKSIRELHTVTLQTRMAEAEATVKTAQAQAQAQYRMEEEYSKAAIEAARREAELQRQTTETEVARREAERKIIAAQAKAQSDRMEGLTEAEIMAAKGINQKDVLQADVQKAYAEGIGNMGPDSVSGGSSGNVVGDIMGLGVGMAAAQAIMPQLGNMFQGINHSSTDTLAVPASQSGNPSWNCPSCGSKGIMSKHCPECGAKRPALDAYNNDYTSWDCPSCGAKGVISKYCPNCGNKMPDKDNCWICPECGTSRIMSKFCPECGHKKED